MKPSKHFYFALIIIIALFSGIFLVQYESARTSEKPAKNFLKKFAALNPERALQETTQQELVSPEALHVPILVYHSVRPHQVKEPPLVNYYDVAPEELEKHLKYFKDQGYTIVSFADFVAGVKKQKSLPEKPVVLTFDDGWENQYKYAFPILQKYSATATFFVFTNAIGHRHFLTWDQIKEMRKAGMIIGAHTKSHPYLFQITDPNILRDEIIGGKKVLEAGLGEPVRFFAYPFGYYNDRLVEVVKEAGFDAARSSKRGAYHTENDLFHFRSIEATDDLGRLIQEIEK